MGLFILLGVATIALTVYWVFWAERAVRALERAAGALEEISRRTAG